MSPTAEHFDVIVIGGGAAGLFCAITAGERGRRVLVIEHANRLGKKILMSGGGRCNFTHLEATPAQYLSANPHFCKSALARFTPWHFLERVNRHDIAWHEKTPGQLFCNHSSKDIVAMLLADAAAAGVTIRTGCSVVQVEHADPIRVATGQGLVTANRLVVATGGLSIPKMGASDFGYRLAAQWGLPLQPRRAGLVPFTLHPPVLAQWSPLAGTSAEVEAVIQAGDQNIGPAFRNHMLVTHRGLSGPALLQVSSFWQDGAELVINWMPGAAILEWLEQARAQTPRRKLKTLIADRLPLRLAERLEQVLADAAVPMDGTIADLSRQQMGQVEQLLGSMRFQPSGTEGYRTAEVTLGGVDTTALSSKTLEARSVPGVHFIGEVVDVTGWLGGYNFQWAWASGWAAGQAV
ncbi:MAG: aminoacetone oxidase family FAD-binding enzyme [Nevskiales bacterium]|nr:aminoacetone oxidase family FAD-binding enzyme [Nevskiales bacterium]